MMNNIMNDTENDKNGHNIVNDQMVALPISQTVFLFYFLSWYLIFIGPANLWGFQD